MSEKKILNKQYVILNQFNLEFAQVSIMEKSWLEHYPNS